jgi:hypothetical protein
MVCAAVDSAHRIVDTGKERRSAERLDYGLFAHVQDSGSNAARILTWVVDLSSRGATLLTAHDLPGDDLLLELQLGEHPARLPVMIRNRGVVAEFESRPGPFFRYGVS